MRDLFKALSCTAVIALGTPALGQETTTQTAPATPELAMGLEESDAVGSTYAKDTHGDWEMRCIRVPEGQTEPCQLYQLLTDQGGNPVAEMNFFVAKNEKGAIAGATIATPLETLLTQNLRLSVDNSKAKIYPFTWCSQVGCFSRVGFTPDDIAQFKKGNAGKLVIVPMAAPDQTVDLNISLSGFTAGFDALTALMEAATQ